MRTDILAINNFAPCNNLQFMQLPVTHRCFISPLRVTGPTVILCKISDCLYFHSLHWNIPAVARSIETLERADTLLMKLLKVDSSSK